MVDVSATFLYNITDMDTYFDNEFDRYASILDERERLTQLHEDASDIAAPIIGDALDAANRTLRELERDEEFIGKLREYGASVLGALEQIESLQSSVELGLISPDVVEASRAEIMNNPFNQRVLEVVQRTKVLEKVAEVEPVEETETPAEKSDALETTAEEEVWQPIQLTIEGRGVQIGKRGRFVRFSNKKYDSQTDYSEERKAFLKALVEHAGEELPVRELWAEAFGDREFDKKTMVQIKMWFENLKFRSQPLVVHNGQRLKSAYSIPNPNVTIKEVAVTKSRAQIQADKETTTPTPIKPSAKEQTQENEDNQPRLKFPLNQAESIILAEFLGNNEQIMERLGLETIPAKLVSDLGKGVKQSAILNELSPYRGDVSMARRAILEKIDKYFKDEETVLSDFDNMSDEDVRSELILYLTSFDADEREFLIEQLSASLPQITVTTQRGTFTTGEQIKNIRTGTVFPNGDVVGRQKDDEKPEENPQTPEIEEEQTEEAVAEPETEVTETTPEAPVEKKTREPKWLTDLRPVIVKTIEEFESDGLLESSDVDRKLVFTKSSMEIRGTETMIERGISANIIKSDPGDSRIPVSKFIAMSIVNGNPQAFGHRSRTKQVLRLIDELLAPRFAK